MTLFQGSVPGHSLFKNATTDQVLEDKRPFDVMRRVQSGRTSVASKQNRLPPQHHSTLRVRNAGQVSFTLSPK